MTNKIIKNKKDEGDKVLKTLGGISDVDLWENPVLYKCKHCRDTLFTRDVKAPSVCLRCNAKDSYETLI